MPPAELPDSNVVAQKSARKRRRPDKAKTKTGSLRDNRPGSTAELEPKVVGAGIPCGVLPPVAAATTDMPQRAPADIERTEPEPVAFATREWEPPTSAIMEPVLAQAVNAEPTPAETESARPGPATSGPAPSRNDSPLPSGASNPFPWAPTTLAALRAPGGRCNGCEWL